MFSFNSVSKEFKTDFWAKPFVALKAVSFELKPGNIVGFLGANGAGKTTGIKILLKFIKPSSGEVRYHEELGSNEKEVFRNIGYLPERPYFYQDLTGREFLSYIGQLNNLSSSEILEGSNKWSDALKIKFALDRKLRFYSKGMLQRLGFASTLIHEPKLLILDEPLSGLDPLGRKEFKSIMNTLADENKTIFFSSHILSDVEEVSEDVVILEEGSLVYSGNISELIREKSSNMFELSIREGQLFEPGIDFNKKSGGGLETYTFDSEGLEQVLAELAKSDLVPEKLRRVTPTLEDIIYKEKL